jgi:hypothetical protein
MNRGCKLIIGKVILELEKSVAAFGDNSSMWGI